MSDSVSTPARANTRRVPRSRGATSGLLLILLGAWGALIPFVGPYFNFAYTPSPNSAWHFTAARGWYEVLPGAVTAVGGLLLLVGTTRMSTLLGAWLATVGGAWFVVGPPLSSLLSLGSIGAPDGSSKGVKALEALAFFYALGAVIVFLGGAAFGRLSVVTLRDVRAAERRAQADADAENRAAQEAQRRREADERDAEQRRQADERDAEQRRTGDDRVTDRRDVDPRDGAPLAADGSRHDTGTGADTPTTHFAGEQGRQDVSPQSTSSGAGYPPPASSGTGYPESTSSGTDHPPASSGAAYPPPPPQHGSSPETAPADEPGYRPPPRT